MKHRRCDMRAIRATMCVAGVVGLVAVSAPVAGAYTTYQASSTATTTAGRTCTMRVFGYANPKTPPPLPTDRVIDYGVSDSCDGSALPVIDAYTGFYSDTTGLSCTTSSCPPMNYTSGCNAGASSTLCSHTNYYVGLNAPTDYQVGGYTTTSLPAGEHWVSYGSTVWGCFILGSNGYDTLHCTAGVNGQYSVNYG